MDQIITDKNKLRLVSLRTSIKEVEEMNLLQRLKDACKDAWVEGCGLAAIQIGVPLRFAWFRWGDEDFTLLNPEIMESKGNKKKQEGCLSIPNKWTWVRRPYKIKYVSDGKAYTAKDFKARLIEHEIDHMNGILNIDKE